VSFPVIEFGKLVSFQAFLHACVAALAGNEPLKVLVDPKAVDRWPEGRPAFHRQSR